MCLIVFKEKADSKFTEDQFTRMIDGNPHGLGIMFPQNGRIVVQKSLGSPKQKIKLWRHLKNLPTYAIHARWKTHGKIDLANCHPYKVLSIDDGDPIDCYMMHNGVIHDAPSIDKNMSDTWNFIEGVVKPIMQSNPDLLWNNKHIRDMVENSVRSSKLLFMRSDDKEVLILNKNLGTYSTDCWLSNFTSVQRGARTPTIITPANTSVSTKTKDTTAPNTSFHWWEAHKKSYPATFDREKFKKDWEEEVYGGVYTPEKQYTEHEAVTTLITNKNPLVLISPTLPIARTDHLELLLKQMQCMTDSDMKHCLQDDPYEAIEVIRYFYTKVRMPDEALMAQIMDNRKVQDTVNLIRHLNAKDKAA